MSRDSVLARGRAMAEAGMKDTVLIQRLSSESTDDLTGTVTPTWATVYEGKCRIQLRSGGSRTEVGEASPVVVKPELQLPIIASTSVGHGDRATVISAADDPALAGHVFFIRDVAPKSEATARRLVMEEAT